MQYLYSECKFYEGKDSYFVHCYTHCICKYLNHGMHLINTYDWMNGYVTVEVLEFVQNSHLTDSLQIIFHDQDVRTTVIFRYRQVQFIDIDEKTETDNVLNKDQTAIQEQKWNRTLHSQAMCK